MGDVEGKVAFITGAASGIGAATAELFAREGATVVLVDLDEDRGREVADRIKAEGGTAEFVRCDVSVFSEVENAVQTVVSRRERIDVLFNNAAVIASTGVVDTTPDDWNRIIGINLTGVFNCAHCVLPHLIRQGSGSIISTASPHAVRAGKEIAAYAAAKGGVIALTKQMAVDYGRSGVRVNCVIPGAIDTPMLRADIQRGDDPEANVAGWADIQPIGRVGYPIDIAKVVLWLATDGAEFVHGAAITADGGLLAQLLP